LSKKIKMKNLIVFEIFIMTLVFAQFAQGQTVDEVVNKYVSALGGKEMISALSTLKIEGSMSIMGNDVDIVITKKHLVGMRFDISIMGTENYQIITPTKGLVFMPVQGMTEPVEMPEEQLMPALAQLDLQGALVNYKEKGTIVELVGKEKVEGEDCYNLKLTFQTGVVSNYFISEATSFIVKTSGKTAVNGEDVEVSSSFSNYKKNAAGYLFAYSLTTMQGQMNFSKIDTNISIDEKVFKGN